MAWTAPRTYSVGEVQTAAIFNVHIRDNLKYLKGQAGQVDIEDILTVPVTASTNGKGLRFLSGSTGMANLQSLDLASNSYMFFCTNRYYDGSAWQQLNARAAGLVQITQDALTYATFPAASSTPTTRFAIDNSGNVGIGTATPAAKLHTIGAGGGFMFVSCDAVNNTLQTPIVAGTVTQSAAFWAYDRNNTGGGVVQVSGNMISTLGGTFPITNTDTITVTVTAGGAITVQRTAGTNGTHQVNMLVMYK
jgi:hypothetical protein